MKTTQRKFKSKIRRKGKEYSIRYSALRYNISTKKKLEEKLGKAVKELEKFADDSNYRTFHIKKSNGNLREMHARKLWLDKVQTRIASLFGYLCGRCTQRC